MMRPEPVSFRNVGGRNLYGMLHPVEGERNEIGVVLLSPGIKNRIGPHRLYVKMARRFQQLGYETLRFDPEGLGDSDGELDERYTADVYGLIQTGRFVEDTLVAHDWMERERGIRKLVVGGLCGGALTGLLAGKDDSRVQGLLGLGMPVILDGSGIDQRKFMTSSQLDDWRAEYLRKFVRPSAWLRLLTLRTDFRVLFKALAQPFRKALGGGRPQASSAGEDNFNSLFPAAYDEFASAGKRMILIFSEADRLYGAYEEKFAGRYPELISRAKQVCDVHIVKDANHVFTLEEWQREVLKLSSDWLSAYFGGRADRSKRNGGSRN